MDQQSPIFDATWGRMVEFQRRPPSEWQWIESQGPCPNNVDRPFYDCSRMGEVLHLEKAHWALHVVDQVQVQPEVQSKESGPTSREAHQEFDCWSCWVSSLQFSAIRMKTEMASWSWDFWEELGATLLGYKKAPFAFWDRAGAVNRRFHFKEENTSFLLIPNVLRFHWRDKIFVYTETSV